MKKINFAIGIHNHQPVGNFDFVFEEAYKKAYNPFLQVLKEHPYIKIALHYSGSLFEWLEKNQQGLIKEVRDMAKSGQVELMTGGFYEPILAVLPDRDKLGQIEKLTSFLKKHFSYNPRGMWIAERIWEPHLTKIINEAGVSYIVVDDAHFKLVGLSEDDLFGYYISEEQGATLKIFPISKKLRYFIPFEIPEKTIEYFAECATETGDRLVVLCDDGEKFGNWPGTYKSVYTEKWLERFFRLIKDNEDWITMTTFSQYIDKYPALGRVYLPCAAYTEMMEWALLQETGQKYNKILEEIKQKPNFYEYSQFLRSGFWRNFFVKYAEANNIHKKMIHVSNKVAKIAPKNNKVEEAKNELWQGQCNDAYWHGVFGGLYMGHLREAIYKHLIGSEVIADKILHSKKNWIDGEIIDFDKDGKDEVLISTPHVNFYFNPAYGGSLFELDYKEKCINLGNILTRRKEAYHDKIIEFTRNKSLPLWEESKKLETIHNISMVKEEGLENYLKYDWYRRGSFIDHFLPPQANLQSFCNCDYQEAGDFVNQPYEFKINRKHDSLVLQLFRNGHIWVGDDFLPLRIEKEIIIDQSLTALINYSMKNLSSKKISVWFGIEFGFMGTSGNDDKCYYHIPHKNIANNRLNSIGEQNEIREIGLIDKYTGLDIYLKFDRIADLWHFPLETISQSETGFERSYQGSVIFPNWKIELEPKVLWTTKLQLTIRKRD